MFLVYVDETGNTDPRLRIKRKDATEIDGDPFFVVTAVMVFAQRWHTFEKLINRRKRELIDRIEASTGVRLNLSQSEVKSNAVRVAKARRSHPFLSELDDRELKDLVDLYYEQLNQCKMQIVSVVVDKRFIPAGATAHDIHQRSWQKLLELIERVMRARNHKHQAIIINDDVTPQVNRSLALLHSDLLDRGTDDGTWLRHICEMPMFVRSELSVGVQLADLCSYNIYRVMKSEDLSYSFFERMRPRIWTPNHTPASSSYSAFRPFPGIWVLGKGSPLVNLIRSL